MLRDLEYRNARRLLQMTTFAGLLVLGGCMTGAKDQAGLGVDLQDTDTTESAQTSGRAPGGYVDPMVANAADPVAQPGLDTQSLEQSTQLQEAPEDLGDVVMQQTGVDANRSSIFSAYQPVQDTSVATASETPSSLIPAGMPQRGINAASGSLFSAPAAAPAVIPPSEEGALY